MRNAPEEHITRWNGFTLPLTGDGVFEMRMIRTCRCAEKEKRSVFAGENDSKRRIKTGTKVRASHPSRKALQDEDFA